MLMLAMVVENGVGARGSEGANPEFAFSFSPGYNSQNFSGSEAMTSFNHMT